MKTMLSIVFGVSVCCLLPSKGMAADATKLAKDAADHRFIVNVERKTDAA
jgi:hypothetical protein